MTVAKAATAVAKKSRPKPTSSRLLLKQDVRGAKAIESHRTLQRARLANFQASEKVVSEKQVLAARTREYRSRRDEASLVSNAQKGRSTATGAASSIVRAPGRVDSNPILLILFTVFGLIIVYTVVTNPGPTGTSLNRLSNWLSLISTSTPIFQKKG